jgi:hypothetical protein
VKFIATALIAAFIGFAVVLAHNGIHFDSYVDNGYTPLCSTCHLS